MKVKLLKKVRKRFSIYYLPEGFIMYPNERFNYRLYELVDKQPFGYSKYVQIGTLGKDKEFGCPMYETEKECIDYLKSLIIEKLKREGYTGRKDQKVINSPKRVW